MVGVTESQPDYPSCPFSGKIVQASRKQLALEVCKFLEQFLAVVTMAESVLDRIVAHKKQEIARAKEQVPESKLRASLQSAPAIRDFFVQLASGGPIRLIAEVKKASPSAGVIRADFDPVAIAETYEACGAHCISVLTDEHFFEGSLDYLRAVRTAVEIPLLRKDFIIDRYQLLEARSAGADAVLLIAECLDDCSLRSLHNATIELGMTPLVEIYDPENLSRVLEAGATLIGVNNRNLHTFHVDLQHSIALREKIPRDCVMVAESGIRTRADVAQLEAAGIQAILVGETFMREADIAAAVKRLMAG